MATKKSELIEIKPIELQKFKLKIIGDTPLIMHAWSEKAKREMLDAQQGKKKGKKKDPKNPVVDFIDSMYWLNVFVIEDTKGYMTDIYKQKKKMMMDKGWRMTEI